MVNSKGALKVTKKIVLITGAGRGIGAATAKCLAERGYAICLNYRSDEVSVDRVYISLRDIGVEVMKYRADVSVEEEVVSLFEAIDGKMGRLTALVNNAGILLPQMSVEQMTAERINKILVTNVTSQFLCAREAVKRMARKHGGAGGAIVNVSSAASRLGSAGEYVDYAASKSAIDTFSRGLANEVASEGIRVNCVRPGVIDTTMHADGGEPGRVARVSPMIPMGRGGTPEEVAVSIAWLLSDEASYVTGSITDVSGGR
ncbi:MAG: NAD(P)-dependent dehydrogenase (short-subunit alcohol dehydrogenase family) [Candidatus Azotimanducaceae bacterium]